MRYKEKHSTAQKPDYEDSICRKWYNGNDCTIEYKWLNPNIDEITDEQKQKANEWIDKQF